MPEAVLKIFARLDLESSFELLVKSWWLLGAVACLAGFLGLFNRWLSFLLLIPISLVLLFWWKYWQKMWSANFRTRVAGFAFALVWSSHFVQVLVPETGFDAVWYHLPVVAAAAEHGRWVYLPELYQSVNPLWSDSLFGLGYLALSDLGAKLVAYAFGLSLVAVTARLSSTLLSKTWQVLVVLGVSLFQVVAWQSASFYVDVAHAWWLLASIWMIYQRRWVWASLMFGAALATKLFSIATLPVIVFLSWWWQRSLKPVFVVLVASLGPAVPFYAWSWFHTGHLFYSLALHTQKLGEIGGQSLWGSYIYQQFRLWPTSVLSLFTDRAYLSPVIWFASPLLVLLRKMWLDRWVQVLGIFFLHQYFLWWFVPPSSVRYALSGFIVLLLLTMKAVVMLSKQNHWSGTWWVVFIVTMALLSPRLVVNIRSWKYLSGRQTKTEYLQQFQDGHLDPHLTRWHSVSFEKN